MVSYFRDITRYIKPYWYYAALNMIFNALTVVLNLVSLTMVIPFLELLFAGQEVVAKPGPFSFSSDAIQQHLNYFIQQIIIDEGKTRALILICIVVLTAFFFKNLFRYLAMYYIAPLRNNIVRDIRNATYNRILILPLAWFNERRRGDIMARVTTDAQEVEWSVLNFLTMIFRDPLSFVLFLSILIIIDPGLTLFVIFFLPVAGYLISLVGKNLASKSFIGQQQLGTLVSIIEESISGLRVIKAFNAFSISEEKFETANEEYAATINNVYRKRDLSGPVTEFLGILVLVIIIWIGGRLVLHPEKALDANMFIFFIVIFSQLIPPARSIISAYYNVKKGSASLRRINEVLDADEVITEKPGALPVKEFRESIEFVDVNFSYEKSPVLKNIKLSIEKGKTIALAGPSGGGKSTLLDLLPRFFDCSSGMIRIDGIDIRDFIISDLRSLFGIVSQDTVLFNDTVFNNIVFGMKDVSREEVINAAHIANAHDFIIKMERGYESYVGDMGVKLSGGQRQRIAIARAVLRDPQVLLLDEATSALDTESEKLVQDALEKLLKNRTAIVVAHRLSTIIAADEIVVLDKGEIIEKGTHYELLSRKGLYCELYGMQEEFSN